MPLDSYAHHPVETSGRQDRLCPQLLGRCPAPQRSQQHRHRRHDLGVWPPSLQRIGRFHATVSETAVGIDLKLSTRLLKGFEEHVKCLNTLYAFDAA